MTAAFMVFIIFGGSSAVYILAVRILALERYVQAQQEALYLLARKTGYTTRLYRV